MALKRQYDMTSLFSMASMTDVIFLLLIFFMVTSTFVFPTALEINLPQSSEQTPLKPSTRVYIDSDQVIYASFDGSDPQAVAEDQLLAFLQLVMQQQPDQQYIAVYADATVPYGRVIDVLTLGAQNNLKMVLATKPSTKAPAAQTAPQPATTPSTDNEVRQ